MFHCVFETSQSTTVTGSSDVVPFRRGTDSLLCEICSPFPLITFDSVNNNFSFVRQSAFNSNMANYVHSDDDLLRHQYRAFHCHELLDGTTAQTRLVGPFSFEEAPDSC